MSSHDMLNLISVVENEQFEEAIAILRRDEEAVTCGIRKDIAYLLLSNPNDARKKAELLLEVIRCLNTAASFEICELALLNGQQPILNAHIAKYVSGKLPEFLKLNHCRSSLTYKWPVKMEKRIIDRFEAGECSLEFFEDVSSQLEIFRHDLELRRYKFTRLLECTVNHFSVEDERIGCILKFFSDSFPFHPYILLYEQENLRCFAHEPSYFALNALDNLAEFAPIIDKKKNSRTCLKVLQLFDKNLLGDDSFMLAVEAVSCSLLPFIQDFELGNLRLELMKEAQLLLDHLNPKSRLLVIKRLIEKMCKINASIEGQPQLLAWLMDSVKKNIDVPIFREELGYIWMLVQKLRFEDIQSAAAYYISLFNLIQAQALRGFYLPMLREIKIRVMDSIRDQIRDYKQLGQLKQQHSDSELENHMELPNTMDLIIFNLEYTETIVKDVLNKV